MHPTWAVALLIPVLMTNAAPAQTPHPHAETLHKQAVSWLKQKTTAAANQRLLPDLGKTLHEKLRHGGDFSLILGPNLMRSGKAAYLAAWGDKVFTFELSPRQKEQTGVRPGSVIFMEGIPEREVGRTPDLVKVNDVTFEGGTRLNPNKELAGWLTFTPKEKFTGELVVRVSCLAGGQRVTQFQHIRGGLPVNDRISFRMKSIHAVSGKPTASPAILFVDLGTVTEAGGGTDFTVRSNTLAVLVDVE